MGKGQQIKAEKPFIISRVVLSQEIWRKRNLLRQYYKLMKCCLYPVYMLALEQVCARADIFGPIVISRSVIRVII